MRYAGLSVNNSGGFHRPAVRNSYEKSVCLIFFGREEMNDQGLSIHDFIAHPVGAYRIRPPDARPPSVAAGAQQMTATLCARLRIVEQMQGVQDRGGGSILKYVTELRVSKATQQMPTRRSRRAYSGFFE